ncbi:glycosyltransferase family 2 protein [Flavobacterium sp. ZS1P70]|uniref:Glycosyltransferase family 2 protein n=1 Tax=Flavobacterium zhoui TaxID=3230414 RepID=A0ABW6I7M8_9FLAO
MVKVSICIPTYTRLAYLKELVDSCLNQTYNDFEICISQDATSTGIVSEIKDYCQDLENKHADIVKYKAQKTNLGLAGNWNALVEMAQGEFVFIPGDDDLIAEKFLEKLLVPENLNADVIFCNQNFIDPKSAVLKDLTIDLNNHYKRDLLNNGSIAQPIIAVLNGSVPMSSSLIRREWFLKFSFDNFINTPELEVFLKIAVSGGKFVFINEKLSSFRIHPGSATNSGLTTGRYISNIIDIEIPVKYEEFKADLVQKSIIPAINNAIKKGEKQMAIKLFHSGYYPKNKSIYKQSQKMLLILPNFIAAFFLKLRDK